MPFSGTGIEPLTNWYSQRPLRRVSTAGIADGNDGDHLASLSRENFHRGHETIFVPLKKHLSDQTTTNGYPVKCADNPSGRYAATFRCEGT